MPSQSTTFIAMTNSCTHYRPDNNAPASGSWLKPILFLGCLLFSATPVISLAATASNKPAAIENPAPEEPQITAEQKQQIASLLRAARADVKAVRLTSPRGRNALEKYRQVLKLQPQNSKALQGIRRIAMKYFILAASAWPKSPAKTDGYIEAAQTLVPGIQLPKKLANKLSFADKLGKDKKGKDILAPEMIRLPPGVLVVPVAGQPDRVVTLPSFAISRREVNRNQWFEFAKATEQEMPSCFQQVSSQLPITCISQAEAMVYANWLSKKTGKIYRLPSESEWIYAASAGIHQKFWWGDKFKIGFAVCNGCKVPATDRHPAVAGHLKYNQFGIFNMPGNVREWTNDCWHNQLDRLPEDGKPWNFRCEMSMTVVRGGSWQTAPATTRQLYRSLAVSSSKQADIGIRLVQEL